MARRSNGLTRFASYGDVTTANQITTLEERYRAGRLADVNDAIASVVQQRYDLAPEAS
jgi:hypothetical protein